MTRSSVSDYIARAVSGSNRTLARMRRIAEIEIDGLKSTWPTLAAYAQEQGRVFK